MLDSRDPVPVDQPADHELPPPTALDLRPRRRAPAGEVGGVDRRLAMKPSRPASRHASISSSGVASRTGAVCHARPLIPRPSRIRPPLGLRAVDEQLAVEPEDVEGHERHGRLGQEPGRGLDHVHPPLQALEAGLALLVERHHLPVEDDLVGARGRRPALHLGKRGRGLQSPAVGEDDVAVLHDGDDPLAVELGLEHPPSGLVGGPVPPASMGSRRGAGTPNSTENRAVPSAGWLTTLGAG